MTDFTLRPMEPGDGPAIDALMRTEAPTTAMALTTHYRHDIHAALLAQHPTTYGVVATAPGIDGLVGFATAFLDEVDLSGRPHPRVFLENLKVHHEVRRQGLGGRLAAWRIEEARRRSGDDLVVATGIDATNAASLATARRWSTGTLGPVRVVISRVLGKPPHAAGISVRPLADADMETVVEATNAFYAGFDLYPRQTPETLSGLLAPTPLGPIRQYRLALNSRGIPVAGAVVGERYLLMEDHLVRIPRPLQLLSHLVPILPPGRVIRTIEIAFAWHAPGQLDAGRALWDAIRFEWRDRATHAGGVADPRGPLIDMFRIGRTVVPRVQLMVPVMSPVTLDESRPVFLFR